MAVSVVMMLYITTAAPLQRQSERVKRNSVCRRRRCRRLGHVLHSVHIYIVTLSTNISLSVSFSLPLCFGITFKYNIYYALARTYTVNIGALALLL